MSSDWDSKHLVMLEIGENQQISLNPHKIISIQRDDEDGSVVIRMSGRKKLTIYPEGENTPGAIYDRLVRAWDEALAGGAT